MWTECGDNQLRTGEYGSNRSLNYVCFPFFRLLSAGLLSSECEMLRDGLADMASPTTATDMCAIILHMMPVFN